MCIVNDTVVVMEAASPQRLFNLSIANRRFSLRGTPVSEDHGDFVENTLVYHKQRILALAQIGETDTVGFVHIGDNGVVTQIGGALPHGTTPGDVGGMIEFRGELYVFRGTKLPANSQPGITIAPTLYHLNTVFSSDPPAYAMTETGDAGGTGLDGDLTWIAVAGFADLTMTLDRQAFNGLETASEDDEVFYGQHIVNNVLHQPNAHRLPGGNFSIGHTADNKPTLAALATGEVRVQLYQREFVKLRRVRTALMNGSQDIKVNNRVSPLVVNLLQGGWQIGDRLRIMFAMIYNPNWPAGNHRHQMVYEIDTADFEHRPHDTLFYHLVGREFGLKNAVDIDEGVVFDSTTPLAFLRFTLDRARPTQIDVWPHDNAGHSDEDIGMRLYQIIRYR